MKQSTPLREEVRGQ